MIVAFLLAQALDETITVTATRTETRVAETPSSVVVLSEDTLANTAAPTTDDALRQVAGFTLFRRAGSRVANPTTQGVTLRGIGASGASRALVLDDGVPLNDPFGGWVYWGRVPRVALDRVEVLRGGASDLYGSSAMGGVVQFIRRKSPGVSVDVTAGSESTATAMLFFGAKHFSVAADGLTTDGFVLVRPEERGAVDVAADSRHAAIDLTARGENMFVRGSYYRESRNNGTPLQTNDTTIRHLSAGADLGAFVLRAYASDQDYFQTFSAIAADRDSERLTLEQTVPSRGYGANAQWTRVLSGKHVLVAGADVSSVRGTANGVGGRQRTGAVYAEDIFAINSSLSLTTGVRADWWSDEAQLNPRVSVLWRNVSASAYTAFRAPTLNELYRGFRVGNVNTLPNASLTAENLSGFELGARARNARVTVFWLTLTDTISNVTIAETPTLITRQRRNLGRTWSRGAEFDAEWPLSRDLRASLGWLFVDATVRDGELRGKRIPQVPRNQLTAQLQWRTGNRACPDRQDCLSSTTFGVQTRWSASQFDDDRNELPLNRYFVADAFASHPLGRGVAATFAIENIFDEQVEVSATPVITLGQPRAWRVGLRYAR